MPYIRCSRWNQAAPRPISRRPPVTMSRAAPILATMPGLRKVLPRTSGPTLIRRACMANAVMVVHSSR